MLASVTTIGCAVALATVFGVSGLAKLRDLAAFRSALTGSVPPLATAPHLLRPVSVLVVVAEVLLVACLVAAVFTGSLLWTALGFSLGIVLMTAFTAVIWSMVHREVRKPCRCFGARSTPPAAVDIVRNLVLLAVASLGLITTGAGSTPVSITLELVAASVGIATAALLMDLDVLVWLVEPTRP